MGERDSFWEIIHSGDKMRRLINLARRVAASDAVVLITGESGTGKEMFARAVHDSSPRSGRPLVAVNCAAVPESLLESELFGHEKGSFTGAYAMHKGRFEQANQGTLFLDEIGDMSLPAQAKILRTLEERKVERIGGRQSIAVDIRIICATNQPLWENVQKGTFRSDLFYRLNEVHLALPPLRERRDDIPLLVEHFIKKYNQEYGKNVQGVSDAVQGFLNRHSWPGNVRELHHVIKAAMLLVERDMIWMENIPLDVNRELSEKQPVEAEHVGQESPEALLSLEEMESRHTLKVLKATGWKKSRAAAILKISRPTLDRKIEKYSLDDEWEGRK
jgi:transcriptional regulator with PAS, ATPase and Fis domain